MGRRPWPALRFERSTRERASVGASWDRPDEAFFAAGACHILAFVMSASLGGGDDAEIVHLRPEDEGGDHMVVRRGDRGFDFNGWSDFETLVDVNVAAARERYSAAWSTRLVPVPGDLDGFFAYCAQHGHRLPHAYPGDVLARARTYIADRSVP